MRILITGASGQLGTELNRCLKSMRSEIGALDPIYKSALVDLPSSTDLDLKNASSIDNWMQKHEYDLIINAAAYTNVDGCETHEADALKINALGPYALARHAALQKAKMVHVSTDYVFRGDTPLARHEDDPVCPVSAYGRSKYAGEVLLTDACHDLFIVRTAWLYGYHGKNFVKTMLRLAKANGKISVVADQVGNPTSANDLAHMILELAKTEAFGIYHCTGSGSCSWYDFACAAVDLAGINCQKEPISTAEYQKRFPQSADRPAFSALSNDKIATLLGHGMRNWKDALTMYIQNLPELGN